ncbi:MAG: STN domain-containing protein [Planctomycetota bacterium]|nr:STN domain-containing protein [Planctomycetota bacterium]
MKRSIILTSLIILLSMPFSAPAEGISPRAEDLALTAMELAEKGYENAAQQVCKDMRSDGQIPKADLILAYLAGAYVNLLTAKEAGNTPQRATALAEAGDNLETADKMNMPKGEWLSLFSRTLHIAVNTHKTKELLKHEKLTPKEVAVYYDSLTKALSELVSLHGTLAAQKQDELIRHLARFEPPMEARIVQSHSRQLSLCANFLCVTMADTCEAVASIYSPEDERFGESITIAENALRNKLEDHYFVEAYEYAVAALQRIRRLKSAMIQQKLDQRITMMFEDQNIEDLVSTLSALSDIQFEFRFEGEKRSQRITIELRNKTLETSLNLICATAGLSWYIAGDHIVISDKPNAPHSDTMIPREKRHRIERYDNVHLPLVNRFFHYAVHVEGSPI